MRVPFNLSINYPGTSDGAGYPATGTYDPAQQIQRNLLDTWLDVRAPDGAAPGVMSSDIRLWNFTTGQQIRRLRGHTALVQRVAFSADGSYLLSDVADNTARLWDVAGGGNLIHVYHGGIVMDVALSPDGRFVAYASLDGAIHL